MGSARWSLDTEQSLAQICSAYGPIESIYEVLCPLVDMSLMRLRGVWPANAAAMLIGMGMYASFLITPNSSRRPRGSATASAHR